MVQSDAEAFFKAGWGEDEHQDAVLIGGMFNDEPNYGWLRRYEYRGVSKVAERLREGGE